MNGIKAILIPGNGAPSIDANWFPYVQNELEKIGVRVINVKFPDPILARKKYWLPFLKKLGADQNTILIGHSSGAIAAMRYAEEHKILGSVLVGAYYTDLKMLSEKLSGYFSDPWNWDQIKNNQKWIIQFSSSDDPFIPIEQARFVSKKLNADYHEYKDKQHFGHAANSKLVFPELMEVLKSYL